MPVLGGSRPGHHKTWATKVKTGCLTCKRRRIKCDETKPTCRRCATHRVECEGYPDLSYRPPGTDAPGTISSAHTRNSTVQASEFGLQPPLLPPNSHGIAWTYDHANLPSDFVPSYIAQGSINAWTESLSPYTTAEQRLAIIAWTELAPNMSRSEEGLSYWSVAIPTISWGHSAVRNALMAASTIFHSLRRKDGPDEYATAESKAVGYANKCIRELVSTTVPPEAMIACATLFWIFEMMSGNWSNSLTHLTAGFRISQSTTLSTASEPLVPGYIKAFVGGLPAEINPERIMSMPEQDQVLQANARHRYARPIMRDALNRLRIFQGRLETDDDPRKVNTMQIISRSMAELGKMYDRWPVRTELDEEPSVVQDIVGKFSPFIRLIEDAERCLQDNDITHMKDFVTDFRSCVDHFIWLGACLHLADRQRLIECWTAAREVYSFDESFVNVESE